MRLALQQGYQAEVICFEFNNWSYEFNQQIKEGLKGAKLHIIQAGRKPLLPWGVSVYMEFFFRVIGNVMPLYGWTLSQAVSRRTLLLMREIKKLTNPFDLVVGHNPGALYPTYFAGKKFRCKTGFDVEDYHPGETNEKAASARVTRLMKYYLPTMHQLTFASAPIKDAVDKIVPVDGRIILNWFPANEFNPPKEKEGPVKLIWFSQNISFNRGLELIIPAIEQFSGVELHLFGNCNESFRERFLINLKNVFVHPSLKQKGLHKRLSEFDCGLAIEPGKDANNDLAISNKMLAYFQAGLFIVASNTTGQSQFLQAHAGHGIVIDLHAWIKEEIQKVIANKEELRHNAIDRFKKAAGYSWDQESRKLLEIWEADRVASIPPVGSLPCRRSGR